MSRRWFAGKPVIVVTPATRAAGLGPPERLSAVQAVVSGYPVGEGRTFYKNGREMVPPDAEVRLSIRPVRSKAEAQRVAQRWEAHNALWGIRRFFSQVGAEDQMSDDDLIAIYSLIEKYEAARKAG